jgi:hypothetical protein
MAEIKEFVVNDRRKFTAEGEARPDAPPSEPKAPRPETLLKPDAPDEFNSSARLTETPSANGPQAVPSHTSETASEPIAEIPNPDEPPAPTAEQSEQAARAYEATADRLDTAIRATNPGMEPIPQMTFERVIQSLYMQALIQLGGTAAPGEKPQVDILGARQTIDMVAVFAAKTTGNLTLNEDKLLQSALFELRMGFLEVTQALARQAQSRQPGAPPAPNGPSIVR